MVSGAKISPGKSTVTGQTTALCRFRTRGFTTGPREQSRSAAGTPEAVQNGSTPETVVMSMSATHIKRAPDHECRKIGRRSLPNDCEQDDPCLALLGQKSSFPQCNAPFERAVIGQEDISVHSDPPRSRARRASVCGRYSQVPPLSRHTKGGGSRTLRRTPSSETNGREISIQ